MQIDRIFNETELTLFSRQTGFTFGECFRTSDGSICAVDRQSGQIFIGTDLLRNNVHSLGSVVSVETADGKTVLLKFRDSSDAELTFEDEASAATVMAELRGFFDDKEVPMPSEPAQPSAPEETDSLPLSNKELNEFYSRFFNTGRDSAFNYLVSLGISVEASSRYVDGIDEDQELEESGTSEYNSDGTMTKEALLETLKKLKKGDKIHLEYKPLLGKKCVIDGEFISLKVNFSDRYGSLMACGKDYRALMDSLADELFDYIELQSFSNEKVSEVNYKLKRINILTIEK